MKNTKRLILIVVLAALLFLLVNPSWNPLLADGTKQALATQVQDTFGGLLGGTGMLTPANLICAVAIVILMWLVCTVICGLLELLASKGTQRRSMAGLFTSLTKFICVIVGGVWALSVLGVNLTGIFASLGIASLIIGFGAQSLIEDAITGIFIIFENQYNVGDIIVLNEFRGVVKNIGIRTTSIMDDGGNLQIVNNSDIRNMQNRSKNHSVAVCDVSISYDANIEEVEKIIYEALPQFYEAHRDIYLTPPRYAGVQDLGESSVVLRFLVDVPEDKFFPARRIMNRDLKILFDEKGIEIPFNQLVIHQAK